MPRIAILGGGLCGRLTALQLAEQGLSVALFDKGGAQRRTRRRLCCRRHARTGFGGGRSHA